MASLEDKVVIVTGAGRGIGRALALGLAAAGARVVVNDRGGDWRGEGEDVGPATQVVSEIEAAGGAAIADGGDATVAADVEELVERAVEQWGRLDGVVACAGILRDRMLFSMEEDDSDAVLAVHLRGHFLLARAACRHWRARSKEAGAPVDGSIVCVSSEAGIYGHVGQSNYSAAKGGIISLAWTVAQEMSRYGVRANAVAPRARTRMTEGTFGDFNAEGPHPWDPENVVPAVEFLLSDRGRGYSGQVVVAGGGVLQIIEQPQVRAELETGAAPASLEEVEAFFADILGPQAGAPPFPDLGLPSPAA
jgi:NAD(P)-dependent dehydrogenase (short-subunit alcohol dehydrogenase family)